MNNSQKHGCLLVSSFNMSNLAGYIKNDSELPRVDAFTAPFGQVMPVLMENDLECWRKKPDLAVVWTRPEDVIESYGIFLQKRDVPIQRILQEVDDFCSVLLGIDDRVKFVLVPTWVHPPYDRGLGMLEMKTGLGTSNTLIRMNLKLAERLEEKPNFFLLDAQRWMNIAGKTAVPPKLWYMGKIAFGNEVFVEAMKDIKAALRGMRGHSRKLIVLDLDDTLWGGVVGDVGWESLSLGGHDHIGEAYVDFQRALKSLTNRGIILGIVSKNEEAIAVEAIEKHPEMILRLDDFAGWRINWQDKAQNIVDLVSDLNLGLQSVVFIDDNPVERARVRDALPEVLVPEWPNDKLLSRSALVSLRCFDVPSMSAEDLSRTEMYVSEGKRKDLKRRVGSVDEWLKNLGTKVVVDDLNESNLQRTAQLFNRTNQMNLSTRRMTESELAEWGKVAGRKIWTFRVSDKFGDSGLTGIASLDVSENVGRIVDFILSCRVMGRKVEEGMLNEVFRYAQSIGLDEVYAEYVPTPKNKPCLNFFRNSDPELNQRGYLFYWNLENAYPPPDHIEMIR